VPTLWDRKTRRIVNNESSEIIRMLNSAFDGVTGNRLDFYPEPLRGEIERWNALIYPTLNNGVYRAGFAGTQHAYDEAVARSSPRSTRWKRTSRATVIWPVNG
jgi:putative glutathione S-transferase